MSWIFSGNQLPTLAKQRSLADAFANEERKVGMAVGIRPWAPEEDSPTLGRFRGLILVCREAGELSRRSHPLPVKVLTTMLFPDK
jgi:hypothetical protein